MDHIIMAIFLICCILHSSLAFVSLLLYKKSGHKVFKYLAVLIGASMCSMLVYGLSSYNRISAEDISSINQIFYMVMEPASDFVSFLIWPMTAYAAVGKPYPRRLQITAVLFSLIISATFPIEVISGSQAVNLMREIFSHFLFQTISYVIVFRNYNSLDNIMQKAILKRFLILGVFIIPFSIIFQAGVTVGVVNRRYSEIPFPYFLYTMLFAALCIISLFQYFAAQDKETADRKKSYFFSKMKITPREKEIIDLIRLGYRNEEIGEKLFISIKTVKNHIYSIYRKLDVQNRVQLVNRIAEK